MNFLRKHHRKIKWISVLSLGSGTFWVFTQNQKTRDILDNVIDTSILNVLEPSQYFVTFHEEENVPNWMNVHRECDANAGSIWNTIKFAYARRLMNLSNSENNSIRLRAINNLAKIKDLEKWQYLYLANICDAAIAVGLARIKGVNKLLFTNPPLKYVNHDHHMFVNEIRDYLSKLDNQSNHICLKKFLSQAFVEESHKIIDQDLSSAELSKLINYGDDIFQLSLEAILHHTEIEEYVQHITTNDGLYLLMEIYHRQKDNLVVKILLSRIFSNISIFPDVLEHINKSGWLSIIAEWLNHDDIRISLPASCTLMNLDKNSNYKLDKPLYLIHPVYQHSQNFKADIVFVHGLLGGVFFTWRQRDKNQCVLGLRGKNEGNASITCNSEFTDDTPYRGSDPVYKEYLATVKQQIQDKWNDLEDGFEMICYDTPTRASERSKGPYTCNCNPWTNGSEFFTKCWPKDWLANDCKRIRIVGINYDTILSAWTASCPYLHNKQTLDERSNELISQLSKAGIGDRPIVWVTHSMGGLLVKSILNKTSKSDDVKLQNICSQTKGIVFYSTPHFGSKVATLNPATSLILWPSIEVQELRMESPYLLQLHNDFLRLAEKLSIKVLSFVETKPTIFSAFRLNLLLVEPESGDPQIGECFEIPQDHMGICKPANKCSFLYQKLTHFIREITEDVDDLQFLLNM